MKHTKLYRFYGPALLLVLIFISLAGCGGSKSASPTPAETIPAVRSSGGMTMAEGSVVPKQYATLTFVTGGMVENIMVNDGDLVKSGDVIARLKGQERLQAAITGAELELLTAKQALDTLNKNADIARVNAQLRLANAEKALDKARERRESKQYRRADRDLIDEARANFLLAEDAAKTAEENFSSWADLPEEDLNRAAALSELAKARHLRDQAKYNLNYLLSTPDNLEVNVSEAELRVAEQEVADAKREYEKLKTGADPDELSKAESRIRNAEAALASAKSALSDIILKAPFDGTIVTNNLKEGEIAAPGTSQVVLADLSTLQVETTDLTELNVVNIKLGDSVNVTFDAIPGLDIKGKVIKIKSLGVNRQGDITYTITISLDQLDDRLKWNMTASVAFNTTQ